MPEGCLFCRIVRKEIPAVIVLESEQALAFRDINTQAPLHVLVVPKEHIENALAVGKEQAGTLFEVFRLAQEVAKKEGADRSGFRLVLNNGSNAGQAVDHLHLHILAKRKLSWPPG